MVQRLLHETNSNVTASNFCSKIRYKTYMRLLPQVLELGFMEFNLYTWNQLWPERQQIRFLVYGMRERAEQRECVYSYPCLHQIQQTM